MQSKKECRMYAYDLVSQGKDDVTKLNDIEKEELTSHIIESYDKFHAYEFIGEPVESSEYAYLLAKYMRTRNQEDGNKLLDLMIKASVKYAGNEIVDLLLEQSQELNFDRKFN